MKNIKNKLFILFTVLTLFTGCSVNETINKITGDNKIDSGSENERLNYNYAFFEATKQNLYGNTKNAVMLYKKCLEVDSSSHASNYQLSRIYFFNNELEKAKKYAKTANVLDPVNFWYQINLANVYQYLGLQDSVIYVYEKIVNTHKEKIEAKFELIELYYDNEDYDKCLELCNKIEEQYGPSITTQYYKSRVYEESGNYDKAEEEIQSIIEQSGDNIAYQLGLLELLKKQNKVDKVYKRYKELNSEYPNNYHLKRSLADFYIKQDKKKDAEKIFEDIIKNDSINIDYKIQMLYEYTTSIDTTPIKQKIQKNMIDTMQKIYSENKQVNLLIADFYIQNDSIQNASDIIKELIKNHDVEYYIWEQFFYLQSQLENTDTIYKYSKAAVKKYSEKPTAYLFKGLSEKRNELYDSAIVSYQNGLKYVNYENKDLVSRLYTLLGEVYNEMKHYEKSDSAFNKALKYRTEDDLYLLNNYSYYLSLRGEKLDKAESLIKKCLEKEPDNYIYLDTYSWILFKMGKNRKAAEYAKKAIKNGGDESGEVLEHYGDILFKLGKKEQAIQYWNKAIEFEDYSEELKDKIKHKKLNY